MYKLLTYISESNYLDTNMYTIINKAPNDQNILYKTKV